MRVHKKNPRGEYCPLAMGQGPFKRLDMIITNENIIERIERHCKVVGLAESTFGRKTVNDGKLLPRLRGGKQITMQTYNKILREISKTEVSSKHSKKALAEQNG